MNTQQPTWRDSLPKWVPLVQGIFYIFFGLWSVVSITSFQALTGPKTDLWLVKTVGLLLVVSGMVLLAARLRRRIPLEIAILGAGQALVLGVVDVVYVATCTISWIYLLDALAEGIILAGWAVSLSRFRSAFEYG